MSGNIVLIESLDNRGRVAHRERFVLDGDKRTLTVGRSVDADVTLDDEYVAARHASVEIMRDGRVLVSDLGSVNGIVVAGKRLREARGLELADRTMQLGRSVLRVRTSAQSLPPEKPDQTVTLLRHPAALAAAFLLCALGQSVYASWLRAPRDLAIDAVSSLSVSASTIGVWVAVWALLSRVMLGEWRWLYHLAIALGVRAALTAVEGLLDLGWFMLALPRWDWRSGIASMLALGTVLYLHLIYASSMPARRAALVSLLLPALIGLGGRWYMERDQRRNVNRIEADIRIYPPSLRLRAAETSRDYFKDIASLRSAADEKRRAVQNEEPDTDEQR